MVGAAMREEIIENARLILGDCRKVLPMLTGVDAVVTDPPYGISHSSAHGATWQNTQIANDHDTSARDFVVEWLNGRSGAFCGTWKASAPAGAVAAIVWDKGPAFGMGNLSLPWKPSWECIFVVGRGWRGSRGEGVLRGSVVVSWESAGRVHPHEKPAWLMEHFIERVVGQTILDPFMGSGTTGVACARLGRSFIGVEIHEPYFDIACRRIEAAQRQRDLFVQGPSCEQMGLFTSPNAVAD